MADAADLADPPPDRVPAEVYPPPHWLIRRPVAWWDRFFFAPTPAARLGAVRVVFYGLMFCYWLPADFRGWRAAADLFDPVGLHNLLGVPLLSDPVVLWLQTIFKLALLTSAVGLLTRLSTGVVVVAAFYLLCVQNNFGKIGHSEPLVLWAFLFMFLAPCGDAASLDALIRRRRGRPPPPVSGAYTWPIRAVWVMICVIFFLAGYQKWVWAGVAWAMPDSFGTMLVWHYYTNEPWTDAALHLSRMTPLVFLMGVGSLVLELTFPLALIFRRLRPIIALSGFMMQVGIMVLLEVSFLKFFIVYVFWIPWDVVWHHVAGRLPGRAHRRLAAA